MAEARSSLEAPVAGGETAGWRIASLAAAVAGIGVSGYLTFAHYTSPRVLACSASGLVNCEKVTTSAQSVVAGVPVAVLGLAWFALMALLALRRLWNDPSPWLAALRWVCGLGGMGMVVYLVYAELFLIGSICLWCTVAHALAFVVFITVLLGAPAPGSGARRPLD